MVTPAQEKLVEEKPFPDILKATQDFLLTPGTYFAFLNEETAFAGDCEAACRVLGAWAPEKRHKSRLGR